MYMKRVLLPIDEYCFISGIRERNEKPTIEAANKYKNREPIFTNEDVEYGTFPANKGT